LQNWFKRHFNEARRAKAREMNEEHPTLEPMVAKIEGILEEIRTRLNHLETRFESEIRGLRSELRMNFRWTIGIIFTMWVTIILTILLGG